MLESGQDSFSPVRTRRWRNVSGWSKRRVTARQRGDDTVRRDGGRSNGKEEKIREEKKRSEREKRQREREREGGGENITPRRAHCIPRILRRSKPLWLADRRSRIELERYRFYLRILRRQQCLPLRSGLRRDFLQACHREHRRFFNWTRHIWYNL